jgi:UDP-N-acetylmuramate--alanine ligase
MDEFKKLNKILNYQKPQKNKIFFIGIGGIGMSALALYANAEKHTVLGADQDLDSNTITLLKKANITIFHEDSVNKEIIANADIIVITNTVFSTHRLYQIALHLNKKILYRSQFLAQLVINKKVIGITGSHGKTTTTGITGHLLETGLKNPTVFVGGIMNNYKKNLLMGSSEYVVIEADDAYKSFLDLNPFISVITSISYEHIETYKNLKNIEEAFLKYAKNTSLSGIVIINNDSLFLQEFIKKINHPHIITYGTSDDADYRIKNIVYSENKSHFCLFYKNFFLNKYTINLLGIHNIKNSVAAIIVSLNIEIKSIDIINGLLSYKGIERRFEYKGTYNKLNIYDDYAHHPVEIDAALSILIIKNIQAYVFFQPHKYIRTKYLWDDFISVFIKYQTYIKKLYIVDVYSAGDDYDEIYNSQNLAKILNSKIGNVIFVPFDSKFKNLLDYKETFINEKYKETILLTLGAGIMNRFANLLVQLENNN